MNCKDINRSDRESSMKGLGKGGIIEISDHLGLSDDIKEKSESLLNKFMDKKLYHGKQPFMNFVVCSVNLACDKLNEPFDLKKVKELDIFEKIDDVMYNLLLI